MNRFIFCLLILFSTEISFAEELVNRIVGPGIRHIKFYFREGPWAIDLLEIDLTNPNVSIKSIKAKGRVIGREKTSIMANKYNQDNQWVVGAINADFFAADGTPVNCQITDGKLIKSPGLYSVLGFYENLKPFISILNYNGQVISSKKRNYKIDGVNRNRDKDELILLNHYFGSRAGTNIWGAEISFRTLDNWAVNDTFRIVVEKIDSTSGNNGIPIYGGLLSGHGSARDWLLDEVASNDTIRLILQVSPEKKRIKEAVGGIPRIIRDGKISIEEGYEKKLFATTRHPRTGVGFSRDSTKMFLLTVDGRQEGYSMGMDLKELAGFMLTLGAYQAVNLDGGGSTTMVVRGKIENRPSDPNGERPVANVLLVISKIPIETGSREGIVPDSIRTVKSSSFLFNHKRLDKFFNPIYNNHSNFNFYHSGILFQF